MTMLIKVCGMRDAENIRAVELLGIDMMGFIFYPRSPRYVAERPEYLPEKLKRVGVFVNEDPMSVLETAERFGLDFIQLHGSETVEYCRALGRHGYGIIKAFSISGQTNISDFESYDGVCDYFVFDTRTPDFGGSGVHFDWSLLEAYHGTTPFLLSGGIDVEDIDELRKFKHSKLIGYDLNSRFETQPAMKSANKIEQFITQIKH